MNISRRRFLKVTGTTIIASSLGGFSGFSKMLGATVSHDTASEDIILRLAQSQTNDFYDWFYREKTIHEFSSIPVLDKSDLMEFENSYKQKYYGDVDTSDGFQIRKTSTDKLEVPFHLDDFQYAMPNFLDIPMFNTGKELHLVTNQSFVIADFVNGTDSKAAVNYNRGQDLEHVKSKIAEGEGKTVFILGDSAWVAWIIRQGLVTDDMIVCTMPKQENYQPNSDPLDKIKNQILVYCTSEVGILGYYTTDCSSNYYHVYREDTIIEELNGRLVVTNPRKGFNFIRYNVGDIVKLHEISCDCGFEGIGIQWIQRQKNEGRTANG